MRTENIKTSWVNRSARPNWCGGMICATHICVPITLYKTRTSNKYMKFEVHYYLLITFTFQLRYHLILIFILKINSNQIIRFIEMSVGVILKLGHDVQNLKKKFKQKRQKKQKKHQKHKQEKKKNEQRNHFHFKSIYSLIMSNSGRSCWLNHILISNQRNIGSVRPSLYRYIYRINTSWRRQEKPINHSLNIGNF